jgi:hypothetical protein
MNTVLMAGTTIVNLALISYAIAIVTEQRKKLVSNKVLIFITLGVILDITATALMINGSSKGAFTFHGLIGYSSLSLMLIDAVLLWNFRKKHGALTYVGKKLHIYSRIAFIWWIVAYITGAVLVALRHSA